MSDPTFWESRPARALLPEVAEALVLERAAQSVLCDEELPRGEFGYWCARRASSTPHRHIAMAGHLILAAWPGDHEPTVADLEVKT